MKSEITTAVFYITYTCNDTCEFCFVKDDLNRLPDMTLEAIQENFYYLKKKHQLQRVILSGGEPTLHPQIEDILTFFTQQEDISISLNTNGLIFADPKTSQKIINVFQTGKEQKLKTKRAIALSCSNINEYPPKSPLSQKKLQGIKEALKRAVQTNVKPLIVITITQQNYKNLPQLTQQICETYTKTTKSHPPKSPLRIILRNLYLGNWMSKTQKEKTTINGYQTITSKVNETLELILSRPRINLGLFNLPLCYFQNETFFPKLIQKIEPPIREDRIHINQKKQLLSASPTPFHPETWKNEQCKNCPLSNICQRIQPEYLAKNNFPPLTPFIKNVSSRMKDLFETHIEKMRDPRNKK